MKVESMRCLLVLLLFILTPPKTVETLFGSSQSNKKNWLQPRVVENYGDSLGSSRDFKNGASGLRIQHRDGSHTWKSRRIERQQRV